MGNLEGAPLGQPLALLSNVTLSWKGLPWTRIFMLFGTFVSHKDFFLNTASGLVFAKFLTNFLCLLFGYKVLLQEQVGLLVKALLRSSKMIVIPSLGYYSSSLLQLLFFLIFHNLIFSLRMTPVKCLLYISKNVS